MDNFLGTGSARPVVTGEPRSFSAVASERSQRRITSFRDATRINSSNHPSLEKIQSVVESFVGEIEQRVPNFSAVKINGERAYKLARKGADVEMPVRKVQIYQIDILNYKWPELKIRCHVSSGTYIRTLGEDIGEKLGVGGYLTKLRRTQIGEYKIENATLLDDFMKN